MLKIGERAPEFEVLDHLGRTVRLANYRGRRVVLWFFPKASTPG
jgi:peroxiredoxin Q/BCP